MGRPSNRANRVPQQLHTVLSIILANVFPISARQLRRLNLAFFDNNRSKSYSDVGYRDRFTVDYCRQLIRDGFIKPQIRQVYSTCLAARQKTSKQKTDFANHLILCRYFTITSDGAAWVKRYRTNHGISP